MKLWLEIRPRMKGAIFPALIVLSLFYFSYHAMEGNHGLKAWLHSRGEQAILSQKAAVIRSEREALERKVALLKPDNLDPDLLSEEVRGVLGYTHENEVVIYQTPPKAPSKP